MSKFPTTWHALMAELLSPPARRTAATTWTASDEALLRSTHSQANSWEEVARAYNQQTSVPRSIAELKAKAESVLLCGWLV